MKLCQAFIISLSFVALMLSISNPAWGAASASFVAGTSAGWGFHELETDIAKNNAVDWGDLGIIAQQWLANGCGSSNQWCGGADIDDSTGVDLVDYAILAKDWTKTGASDVLLQTIYGSAQDSAGTITANTGHALSVGKECLMVFNVPQATALNTGWFKLFGFKASYTFRVRLYNVTGQNLLNTGHTIAKSSLDTGALIDISMPTGSSVPYHTEPTGTNYTDLIVNFGPLEVTAGDYMVVFNNVSGGNTIGSMVRGVGATISDAMGKYPDGTPLPKRATVTTSSTSVGNTYFYYLSTSSATSYQTASNLLAFQITTTVVNHPPVVNAGTDQTVQYPDAVNLSGTATDDGYPNPLTTTWSKVSGPGTVTFGDASELNTTATFSDAGTYVLRLTANDSALSTSDDITITSTDNHAPAVNAGADVTVGILDVTNLAGTATDDGLPNPPATVTTTWTQTSGPGTATFGSPSNVNTSVSFSATGTYVLRLTADDSAMTSYDEVTVIVVAGSLNDAPVVNAGSDVAVSFPATVATLSGTATDDGKPNPPAHLTVTWTQQSGPGTVTFNNIHSASTTATASAYGTYVLRLTASDGSLTTYDETTVVWQGYTYGGYEPIATGGEGGTVVHVTTLNPTGPGSFTEAISGDNRIVVFDVSGSIWTPAEIRISHSNITIDGFTAPGAGITIVSDDAAGCSAALGFKSASNVIVRNIRIRHSLPTGDLSGGGSQNSSKCIIIWDGSGIVIDHCSLTGAGDSSIAGTDSGVDHIIISRCLFAGSCEAFRCHGSYSSMHHNLFTVNNRRIPRIYSAGPNWDLRNNVVDQWSNTGTNVYDSVAVNLINNYHTRGYLTWGACNDGFLSNNVSTDTDLYCNGNVSECGMTPSIDSMTQRSTPNPEPINITTTDALTAYNDVLSDVGATPTDNIDAYYITLNGGINPPPTQ